MIEFIKNIDLTNIKKHIANVVILFSAVTLSVNNAIDPLMERAQRPGWESLTAIIIKLVEKLERDPGDVKVSDLIVTVNTCSDPDYLKFYYPRQSAYMKQKIDRGCVLAQEEIGRRA